MAEVIRMPKMSDTMEEGVISSWLKKEGDPVQVGDILAEVETDKATMELEAYEEGTLLYIGVQEKATVPINAVIAIVGEPGENITSLLTAEDTQPSVPQAEPSSKEIPKDTTAERSMPTPVLQSSEKPKHIMVSPLAKKLAQERGYVLSTITGTGEGGRIIKRDIENMRAKPQQTSASTLIHTAAISEEAYEDVPVSGMRQTIARRLAASKFSAPHFYLTVNIDMANTVAARTSINTHAAIKISFNDIIVKATAIAIRQHLAVNVAWLEDRIRQNRHIHIGIAVAITDGLVVPVLRFADCRSLAYITEEIRMLRQQAQQGKLDAQRFEGSTFTISNLGMMGIDNFTAIINPPAACILAIGAIKQVPVVKNDVIVPGYTMNATLSCDHRAVDGSVGATFLQTLKGLLEDPRRMLLY